MTDIMRSPYLRTGRYFLAALLVAMGVAIGLMFQRLPSSDVPVVSTSHPLTINAQRARSYPGGALTVEAQLGPQPGYSLSRVSYPSDGYNITGLMATPATPKPIFGYPVIILAHGYIPQTRYLTDGPEYADYIRAFARAGYVVVKPDFRGYGGSWGAPQSAYYSPVDNADLLNLAASLSAYRPVDAARIGLFGHSLGGHVVLNAVTIAPQRFRAAVIASSGVGNIADMYANWRPPSEGGNPEAADEKMRLAEQFGDPAHNPRFWAQVSPITYARQITTPLLLTHGTADRVIPQRFTMQLEEALEAAGHLPSMDIRPGAGHVYGGSDKAALIAESLALFDKQVKRAPSL